MNLNFFQSSNKRLQSFLQLGLVAGILIFANILGCGFYKQFDLTEEKRFTLTQPTKAMLHNLNDVVYVKILLDGEFPAGFKRLQNSVRELLDDMRSQTSYVEYEFIDPNKGSVEEINARRKELAKDGLKPMELTVKDSKETSRKVIFPYAIISFAGRTMPVNLLENNVPGMPQDVVLNNSVSLLEYKLANGIQKILTDARPVVMISEGHGELARDQTADLEKTLRQFYTVGHLNLDSVVQVKEDVKIVLIAKPRTAFTDQQKFKLDQYIMNGGKVVWMIDRLTAGLDSMRVTGDFVPTDYPLNIEDQLFTYGARINPNLVLDLECSKIPLRVGEQGQAAQLQLFDWFYNPIVASKSKHPIVKSLDRVNLMFPSSIDTIRTKTAVQKTILLETSAHARLQFAPVRLNFEILRYDPDPLKFDKKNLPLAVLLEGTFSSHYKDRVPQAMLDGLAQMNIPFKEKSQATKMVVVADGDIAASSLDPQGAIRPIGYNPYMKYVFANKDFILNTIEYLLDQNGVIEARSKEVKLRPLDAQRTRDEATFWQGLNVALPLLILGIFAGGYLFWRKRRYA